MTMKVLVFESDLAFAETLKTGLSSYGCETTIVDDGDAGIAMASENAPDLILLTIELPRMNGFSVCNKLKRNASLKKVPLVLLSSEATDETFDQHKRLRTRADEYVHKPVTVGELVERLSGLITFEKSEDVEADDIEEVALDDDMEIEEVAVEEETEEAFGNLISKEAPPPADAVEMEDLVLEEGDGLNVAPEEQQEPIPAVPSSPQAPPPAPSGPSAAEEALDQEVSALRSQLGQLEAELKSARDATAAEADAKAQVIQKKDAEVALLERELVELRQKMETKEGAGTAREFLDLREQLNKKDKEILEIRDLLHSKEKEVVRLNDDNISLGRKNADLSDQVISLEKERDTVTRERNAALSDKEQAQKRGDDYKAKSERLKSDLDAKTAELAQTIESHENTLATRDAQDAAMRDDHQLALKAAALAAEEAQSKAVLEAIAETEERALGEKERALVQAAEEANQARAAAVAAREAELKAEQDSRLAALHRANEESLRKLRAEHDHNTEEAERAATERLAARERELAEEKVAALSEQKEADEARILQIDAERAALASDLQTRTEERDRHQATIGERERKIEELEAGVASLRAEVVELGDKLTAESGRLTQARDKWAQDEAALRTSVEALKAAMGEVEAALDRPMP